ncbi:MAG: hypothetical protein ACK5NT_15030, partial [Pyrinomonadaceae bacterium]
MERNILTIFCMIVFALFASSTISSQEEKDVENSSIERANEVLENARRAVLQKSFVQNGFQLNNVEIELNGEEFTSIESAKSKSAMPQYNSRRALQLKYIIAKPNKALSGVTIEIKNKVLSMKTSATLISNGKDVIVNNVTEVNGVRT